MASRTGLPTYVRAGAETLVSFGVLQARGVRVTVSRSDRRARPSMASMSPCLVARVTPVLMVAVAELCRFATSMTVGAVTPLKPLTCTLTAAGAAQVSLTVAFTEAPPGTDAAESVSELSAGWQEAVPASAAWIGTTSNPAASASAAKAERFIFRPPDLGIHELMVNIVNFQVCGQRPVSGAKRTRRCSHRGQRSRQRAVPTAGRRSGLAAQHPAQAADRPVEVAAERVVLHEVRPRRGRTLEADGLKIGSVVGDRYRAEGLGAVLADLVEEPVEQLDRLLVELAQRIAVSESAQVNALADRRERREVIGPGLIQVVEDDLARSFGERLRPDRRGQVPVAVRAALGQRRQRRVGTQHSLTMVQDDAALVLDHLVVAVGVPVDLKVRTLGDALGVPRRLVRRYVMHPPVRIGVTRRLRVGSAGHDQLVGHAGEEDRAAGVALTASTAAKLAIKPAAPVLPGADDVQTAKSGNLAAVSPTAAQPDVGTAAGHLSRDGDRAASACLRNDRGFRSVVLGVQHRAWHACGR